MQQPTGAETPRPDPPDESQQRPDLRGLRAKADEADRLKHELAHLRTDNALLRAGLGGLTDRQRTALLAAHEEGDVSAEAYAATAEDLGFLTAGTPPVPREERTAHARAEDLMSGAPAADAYPLSLEDQLRTAGSQEEVLAIMRGRPGVHVVTE